MIPGRRGRWAWLALACLAASLLPTGTLAAWQASVSNTNSFTTTTWGYQLRSWGYGASGRSGVLLTTVNSTTAIRAVGEESWAALATGDSSTCAITTDGDLYCWGNNLYGNLGLGDTTDRAEPVQVGSASWARVSKGYADTCAIRPDQSLWCWGYNANGQVGNNTTTSTYTPAQVTTSGVTTWSSVTVGQYHVCGLKTDRTLWCWGYGANGRIGVGNTTDQKVPVQVGSGTWASVEAGAGSTCAVRYSDSTLWCWGYGGLGQLASGATADQNTPAQVSGGGTWSASSQGQDRGCGIKTGGTLWCWGYGGYGNLGRNSTTDSNVPVQESTGATTWTALTSLAYATCATLGTGALKCWGQNGNGQLGDGSTTDRYTPVASGSATTWNTISGGSDFFCGIRTDAALWCQGHDDRDQLGHDYNDKAGAPTPLLAPGATWLTGSTGPDGGCAIQSAGTMWCWGPNGDGQAGVGDTAQRDMPVQAGSATTWAQVSMGGTTTCAVRTNNSLWCWGNYLSGQLGVAAGADVTSPAAGPSGTWSSVSVGDNHTCGISTAGALSCWGQNGSGQLGIGNGTNSTTPQSVSASGVSTWSSVSAGYYATCAVAATGANAGSLYCWGQNTQGQVGNGGTTSPQSSPVKIGSAAWSDVVMGRETACGIRAAGTLWCWGYNNYGQLGGGGAAGTPTRATSPTQIGALTTWTTVAAGDGYACATRGDQTAWCWGRDTAAELGDRSTTTVTSPQQVPALVASWIDAHGSARVTLAL